MMKTDAKTMAEIYRHMADNLDNGKDLYDGVQFINSDGEWRCKDDSRFYHNIIYRLKPKTITLSNGVVIPEYLSEDDIKNIDMDVNVYIPSGNKDRYITSDIDYCIEVYLDGGKVFAYLDKIQAIEASKTLFGIE